jgi:hypothetical protein
MRTRMMSRLISLSSGTRHRIGSSLSVEALKMPQQRPPACHLLNRLFARRSHEFNHRLRMRSSTDPRAAKLTTLPCRRLGYRQIKLLPHLQVFITISTRRFCWRPFGLSVPSGFEFSAIGRVLPKPFIGVAAGINPWATSHDLTVCARCSLKD